MKTQDRTIDWKAELPLHREWMVALARARLSDPHAAEDIVQDVCLGVVRRNPELADPNKTRVWLYQAVVRRVADHLRRQYRQSRTIEAASDLQNQGDDEQGWNWLLASEQRDLLAIAIKRLDQQDREIVLLKFTQNWSYQQLARKFGLPERAIEYRLVTAKQKLRTELMRLNGNEHE